jgi:two-component system, sensor histidine kinase
MSDLAPRPDVLVLNVNDHDGVRYMISRILDRAGYVVAEASSGTEALDKVQTLKPKLIVLDIKLPDMSGLDVCRQVKSDPETRSIKILHTSAVFVAPEAKVQSLNSGADSYLSHPFEQEELIATARSLLRLLDAEQKLRDTAEELRRANQRTNEFLAMLAHELRNPLSAISSCFPLLERESPRDDTEKFARGVMRRQTRHLRRLVDDLLDAARVTQGKIEPKWETVDLVALLARVTDSSRHSTTEERKQTLNVSMPPQPVKVRGDSLRLEQIFYNLLDNASKYTGEGGQISVELSVPADGSGFTRVVFIDNGIGIPQAALSSIFDLFSQASVPLARSRGGLGIGLTVVKSLVELHGGQVRAWSAGEGKGCEVEVLLPLLSVGVASPEDHSRAQPDAPIKTTRSKRKVVIVEDNIDAQRTLQSLLQHWGHEVAVASDGEEGIDAIKAQRPEIALVDIGLPVTDGYELARRLQHSAIRKSMLLVALTGYGSPEQRARAMEAGFDLHLVKPVEPDQLEALIAAGREGVIPASPPADAPAVVAGVVP